ncbi:ead/Ea22-like family protein [Klebsiella pneumoniae]|uniref:ead/Ea22-like family protein n=1 Tax=Klebsiella pneumoniae TaxID=573 RepID=UPI001D18C555|nr:ead/Ea22-like family protein [Klebsiella pneumoniae]
MTTDITELALIKGQRVEAPYYLAECTECGKMYSSSKLIESRNYFDGDADCYCPHCNADDADIADLGGGEQPAVMAWNYQQARIDALVEALEKAQKRIVELESRTVTVKQGEVLVTVAGFTGCGKSAIAGEIEIAMKAIGLPVTWANGDSEKRMTGADWLTAIEMYKPTVRIVEVNIPRAAGIKVEDE